MSVQCLTRVDFHLVATQDLNDFVSSRRGRQHFKDSVLLRLTQSSRDVLVCALAHFLRFMTRAIRRAHR